LHEHKYLFFNKRNNFLKINHRILISNITCWEVWGPFFFFFSFSLRNVEQKSCCLKLWVQFLETLSSVSYIDSGSYELSMTQQSHYMMIMACCQTKFGYLVTTIAHEWFQHNFYLFCFAEFFEFLFISCVKKFIIIIKLNICKLRLLGVNYWP
jgi:hypothetical protein